MYLKYYGLSKKPFELIPDPAFIHLTAKHRLAYSLLEYAVYEQTGLTVISGEIGSGKTTLIKKLLDDLQDDNLVVGLIDNTHESWGDLCTWIASAFDIAFEGITKASAYKEIKLFLIKQYALGKRVILIVDEAQNMNESTLEELRLFTNINSGNHFLLQIILIGQPELSDILCKPELAQLAQRVSVEYHLEALNDRETGDYLFHRLSVAGCQQRIFDELAISQIHKYSGGIPRLINIICDNALVYGYAQGRSVIGGDIILDVVSGRKIIGLKLKIPIITKSQYSL